MAAPMGAAPIIATVLRCAAIPRLGTRWAFRRRPRNVAALGSSSQRPSSALPTEHPMTTTTAPQIAPADVHATLARHILADGYDHRASTSRRATAPGSTTPAAGREYLDFLTFFGSNPIGLQPPEDEGPRVPAACCCGWPSSSPRSPTSTASSTRSSWTPSAGSPCPRYLPHAFFVEGGALGVENALKTAFDWKVRRNKAAGHRRARRAARSSTSARPSTAAPATPCRSPTPTRARPTTSPSSPGRASTTRSCASR